MASHDLWLVFALLFFLAAAFLGCFTVAARQRGPPVVGDSSRLAGLRLRYVLFLIR